MGSIDFEKYKCTKQEVLRMIRLITNENEEQQSIRYLNDVNYNAVINIITDTFVKARETDTMDNFDFIYKSMTASQKLLK